MGLFDFLPKRAIKKKLSQVVERDMGTELTNLIREEDPTRRRQKLKRAIEIKIQKQARLLIPMSLRQHARPIIESVTNSLVPRIEAQVQQLQPS